MLRKKILKKETEASSNDNITILRKNVSYENTLEEKESRVESSSENIVSDHNETNSFQDIGKWLVNSVTSEKTINNLQENLLIPIPNVESSSRADEWLNMLIKSYLTKEDIEIIASNIQRLENKKLENINTIESLKEELEELKNNLSNKKEIIEKEKNRSFKLQKQVDQMMHMEDFIEYNFANVDGSEKLKQLLLEAIKSDSENLEEFIIPFAINSQNIIMLKKYMKHDEESDLNMFMDEIKILLKSISGVYIPQRKELLEELAKAISTNFEALEFISPEEYTYVEPKLHNIPSSGGQKVIEGKSFAVIKTETKQTIIYADIEAQ